MNVMEETMREVFEKSALSLTAAEARERSQVVVRQESDKLMVKIMTEVEVAISKGSFRIAIEAAEVPMNVCRHTVIILKERGFVTDVNGAILRVSWGGMDHE